MEHEEYLEWISADLDGELTPTQHHQLQEHLQACPSCAQLYEELSQQSASLRALNCAVPTQLHQAILDQLPPQQPAPRPRRMWKVWAPLAACLALVVTLGYAALQPKKADTPALAARSNPGVSPAVCSVQPQALAVPGGDTVLLLSQPLTQDDSALLKDLPTTTLDGGYVCCVTDPDTAHALMEHLTQTGQAYTQASAASPDGSGSIAVVWPQA